MLQAQLDSQSSRLGEVCDRLLLAYDSKAIVPEVQMGDVLTHNNIWFYRQLAGGLTTTMIKHGSANPIGGENVYVKIRWGALPDELKFAKVPRTVKFA